MMERTLVLLKPDAVQRELLGEIINIFERKGLKIVGLKFSQLDNVILKEHYSHISEKPFFPEIRDFMKGTPIVCIALEGVDAVNTVREMAGITLARAAGNGSIRGMYGMSIQCNLVHTSDSIDAAEVELNRFFLKKEIFSYNKITDAVIYSSNEKK